jgi:outer membrane cobalamin receptor
LLIHGRYAQSDADAFPDASGGPRLAVLRERDERELDEATFGVRGGIELARRVALDARAGYFRHEESAASPGVAPGVLAGLPPSRSDTEFTRAVLDLYATLSLGERVQTVLGATYQDEDGRSRGTLLFSPDAPLPTDYRLRRSSAGAYGELRLAPAADWTVVAGVRADDPSSAARETTGKVTVEYRWPGFDGRVHASWAEGFKLPSFFSLGHPLVGNPDLDPERARSMEVGAAFGALDGALDWRVTAFSQRFSDLIDFDFETFKSVNRAKVDIDGVELGAVYRRGERLSISAQASLMDVEALDGDRNLAQRPERLAGVNAEWRFPRARGELHFGWLYVGERFDSSIPTGERSLASYDRLDAAWSWQRGNLGFGVAVDNLLDAEFEQTIGFPHSGRALRFSVRVAPRRVISESRSQE